MSIPLQLPPLSLYVHIPWCVQKCPYCDFNSHGLKQAIPEQEYVMHLLSDLEQDIPLVAGREIQTLFIGGGTPSLFSPAAMAALLQGIADRIAVSADAEITMEANPGTVEKEKFQGFVEAGVNRISIGVQSFQVDKLSALGRIHDHKEASNAGQYARSLALRSYNIDLMHGLPNQSIDDALFDLKQAISLAPPHLSWYQLTIEPNTLFHSKPPVLPEDETLWEIQEQGQRLLAESGYQQYEISAYAKQGMQCQHNLNYWRFGDYLGIGCGAHGKITLPNENKILRTSKVKHPKGYMNLAHPYIHKKWEVAEEERFFEYFMNRFRLVEACPMHEFEEYTGIARDDDRLTKTIEQALAKKLLLQSSTEWQVSDLGKRYLNELLGLFL